MASAAAGRQAALVDWALVIAVLGVTSALISTATVALLWRAVVARHERFEHAGTDDVRRLARVARTRFRAGHLIAAGGWLLVMATLARTQFGLPISALFMGPGLLIATIVAGSGLRLHKGAEAAVTLMEPAPSQRTRLGREALARLRHSWRVDEALKRTHGPEGSAAAIEVLGVLRDGAAFWPKLAEQELSLFGARMAWRFKAMSGLSWHGLSAGLIAWALALWLPLNVLPPLPSPLTFLTGASEQVPPEEEEKQDEDQTDPSSNDRDECGGGERESDGENGNGQGGASDKADQKNGQSGEGQGDTGQNAETDGDGGQGQERQEIDGTDRTDGGEGTEPGETGETAPSEQESGEAPLKNGESGSSDGQNGGDGAAPEDGQEGQRSDNVEGGQSEGQGGEARENAASEGVQKGEQGTNGEENAPDGQAGSEELPSDGAQDGQQGDDGDGEAADEQGDAKDGGTGTEDNADVETENGGGDQDSIDGGAPDAAATRPEASGSSEEQADLAVAGEGSDLSGDDSRVAEQPAPDGSSEETANAVQGGSAAGDGNEVEAEGFDPTGQSHPFAASGAAPEGLTIFQGDLPEYPENLLPAKPPTQRIPSWIKELENAVEN
ncbi:hypothetical protein [Roseovarius pelagicus]|uniref:hypothetical protein n=1 Tax=Roseovarius pelagicus TaxID=2980108 RepID=UPI0021D6631C|nr:hypothetical protein [Roseovarius pelagicus]